MSWFPQLRAVAYLKRMAMALERIADMADAQRDHLPRKSRRGEPKTDIYKPTLGEWNERYREDHPEMEWLEEETDV